MKLAIFDLDGTLYDSMGIWMGTAYEDMVSRGAKITDDLRDRLIGVSSPEAATVLAAAFPELGITPNMLIEAWREKIMRRYREDIDFKPGAAEYLRRLKGEGVGICVATLTPRDYFTPAFERTGLSELIDFSINAAEAGRDKRFPDIYIKCAERFNLVPGQCRVYEDSPLAAATARAAGFEVWGIADPYSAAQEKQLRELSHYFVSDWRELNGAKQEGRPL